MLALTDTRDYVDMVEEKWLTNALFTTVDTKADLTKVRRGVGGDFLSSSLSKVMNNSKINNLIVQAWMTRAKERKSTLVFCVDVAHLKALAETFRENGIDARYVEGSDLLRDREAILEAFKQQRIPVLLNCAIFTEGTDIPNIDCVLLARPTKSRNLLVQMIGRGMRLSAGKENCHVIDMVSSLETGIVSTPTLFGLDPAEILKEASTDDIRKLREEHTQEIRSDLQEDENNTDADAGSLVFTDYESVQDLIEDTSAERHIRATSKLAWVQVDRHRYILAAQGSSFLTIEKQDDGFRVRYNAKLPRFATKMGKKRSPYARSQILAVLPTLTEAVRSADTFAKRKFVWAMIATHKAWRTAPASEGQLSFLNKLRGKEEQLTASDVTRGKATDMITKIKFGAKGRLDKMTAKLRRKEEKMAKQERLALRERVRVGPILNEGTSAFGPQVRTTL